MKETEKYMNPAMEHYEVDGQMDIFECEQLIYMQRKLKILKATLILREILGIRSNSKEETIRTGQEYTDSQLSLWIDLLHKEIQKSDETRKKEAEERIQWEMDNDSPQECMESGREYTCCTNHDYGPSNPWDAPFATLTTSTDNAGGTVKFARIISTFPVSRYSTLLAASVDT